MLTRRQKRSIQKFACVMTFCVLFSVFLIYTNITSVPEIESVRFSDILEGATAYADENESPAETLGSAELLETMFSEELLTFAYEEVPEYDYDDYYGAGGDLLVNTTKKTTVPEETTKTAKKTTAKNDSSEDTTVKTVQEATSTQNTLKTTAETTRKTEPFTYSGSSEQTAHGYTAQQTTFTATVTAVQTTAPATSYVYSYDDTTRPAVTTATAITTSRTASPVYTSKTAAVHTTATKATTKETTKTTTKTTTAPKTTVTDKTAFTNIGGGVLSNDTDVYLTLFALVNKARKENGLNELWYSARVHEVCELRATELSSYYSHTRPNGTRFSTAFREIGVNYAKCGENIAYGRNMFETPEEVFQAWMDSPSHRENILSPDYECVAFGLSVLKVGANTYYYWTQEFALLK